MIAVPMSQTLPSPRLAPDRRSKPDRRRLDRRRRDRLAEELWSSRGSSNRRRQATRSALERRHGKERRENPRPRLLNVHASSPGIEFVLLEISPFGMSMETNSPLVVGRTYKMKIQHKLATVTVQSRVTWCKLHRTLRVDATEFEPRYRAGLILDKTDHLLAVVSPVASPG